jgi:iron complex outermembrane receptor protein
MIRVFAACAEIHREVRNMNVTSSWIRWRRVAFGLAATVATSAAAQLAPASGTTSKLKKLSIEELMDVEVVSVSRHAEKLSESASAVRVISGEEIHRAGATTLPQALRLASNLHVAQLSASYWTIGARGLNQSGTTSNKLLVMIDGRSIYSPLVTGTYWDQRDVFLPDVDRIEVISGPGGSAWGANAVNGVINILTKSAAQTQGGLVYAGTGLEENAVAGLRYGGALGRWGHYRVYAKHLDYDDTLRSNGTDARNRWVFSQTGVRTDTKPVGATTLMVQGNLYTGWVEQAASARGEYDGGDVQARWTVPIADDSTLTAHAYYDSARRGAPTTFADRIDVVDVEVQHEWRFGTGRHRLVSGAGHRRSDDKVRNLPNQAFLPANFVHRLSMAFVHTELTLLPDRLRLIVGSKYEENNYSGADHSPNVRLAWFPAPGQTVWTAVSRAVRTPSRVDRDLFIPTRAPFTAAGGPNFGSEELLAFELGWKGRVGERASASLATYVHDYHGLRTLEQPVPFQFANGLDARTYGAELFFQHALSDRVTWNLGYTWFKSDFRLRSWSRDLNNGNVEIADPEHQAQLRVSTDLTPHWELDLGLRYVARVPTLAARVVSFVPAYLELDARVAYVRGEWEFAVIGTNLLDRAHPETGQVSNRREIQRSVQARVQWRF